MNRYRVRRIGEFFIERALFLSAAGSILVTAGIIGVLLFETIAFLREVPIHEFLFGTVWTPLFSDKHFGVLPLVSGTLLSSAIAMLVALPAGLMTAIYLSEYAPSAVRRTVKPVLELLAGVPTVVYGYFALLFVTPLLQKFVPELSGFNALSPGIVMGIMILPLVSSLSEDALRSVPNGLREGAYALGATRMEAALRVVLPAAFSGVSAACVLAVSRAIGEAAPLIVVGGAVYLTFYPSGLGSDFTVLPLQIFNWISQPQEEFKALAAAGMIVLLAVLLLLNAVAIWLRNKYEKKW